MIKEYQLRKLQNSYEVTLNYKGVKVRVAFTGGNVYKGTMPRFRTNDLFTMRAVENSELFKNKEVVVLRTINEKTDIPQTVVQQRKKVVKPAAQQPAPKPEPPKVQEPVDQDPPVLADGETKEFANLGEAILYIAQTWQEQAKTEKEAREILKAHGINPRIKKG